MSRRERKVPALTEKQCYQIAINLLTRKWCKRLRQEGAAAILQLIEMLEDERSTLVHVHFNR
ncbi:MAG: hypothetical protein E4H07_09660, partial [Nitrosomonadales bacterium]